MYLQNDTAAAIRRVQEYLYEIHKYEGITDSVVRDGIYGEQTRKAVEDFQIRFGLPPTGTADLITFEALRSTAKKYRQENNRDLYLYSKKGYPLCRGSVGADVDVLHALLRSISEYEKDLPPIPRSGYFSAETETAVNYMQKIFLMEPNGIVSAAFFERLENELKARRSFITEKT